MKKIAIFIFILITAFTFNLKKVNALNTNRIQSYQSTLALECNFFGDDSKFQKWLTDIYGFIKFLAPTLAVIFTVIEFFKAIVSDKKEALQTAAKRTGIRIVLCLLIFFVPVIINFIFGTILHMCGTGGIE